MAKSKRNDIGKRLSELLKEAGITVSEASTICGVTRSSIQDWKSGSVTSNFEALNKLAERLGVTLSYILIGRDDSRPQGIPNISEVFESGDMLFDGFAEIKIKRLIPKGKIK